MEELDLYVVPPRRVLAVVRQGAHDVVPILHPVLRQDGHHLCIGGGCGEPHYTTTPRLAMDGLTLKAATATNNLTLKSYSDRLLQTL